MTSTFSFPNVPGAAAVCFFALALFACGGSMNDASEQGTPTSTLNGADASAPTESANDRVVLPHDATLVFTREGGLQASAPDRSICSTSEATTYAFTLATGQITWKMCVIDDAKAKNVWATGSRIISAADQAALKASLDALRVVRAKPPCGSDYSETLEIDSASALAPETLYPPFQQCADAGLRHATGIDDVGSELQKLAH